MPFTELNGTQYFYERSGKGSPLVFAHGLFVDRRMFASQVNSLQAHFACYSFDMPGHGKSRYTPKGWTLEDVVEDFRAFIIREGLGPVTLIGQSQGGMVFMRLAIKYPEIVSGLILIGTSPLPEYPERIPFWESIVDKCRNSQSQEFRECISGIQQRVVAERFLRDFPDESALELNMMVSQDPHAMALATESAVIKRTDISRETHTIRCPVLIICGNEDHATPLEVSEAMVDKIPNATLLVVEGAAHHLPIEKPTEVLDAIEEFMSVR